MQDNLGFYSFMRGVVVYRRSFIFFKHLSKRIRYGNGNLQNVKGLQFNDLVIEKICRVLCKTHNKYGNFTLSSHIEGQNVLQFVIYQGVGNAVIWFGKKFF